MDAVWPYVAAIVPTILVATLFYFLIKSMLEGDRRERLAQSRFEAEEDRRRGAATGQPGPQEGAEAGGTGPASPPVDEPPNSSTNY